MPRRLSTESWGRAATQPGDKTRVIISLITRAWVNGPLSAPQGMVSAGHRTTILPPTPRPTGCLPPSFWTQVEVQVEAKRTTHAPMQANIRLSVLPQVLPDVQRGALRETQPHPRREVPVWPHGKPFACAGKLLRQTGAVALRLGARALPLPFRRCFRALTCPYRRVASSASGLSSPSC